MLIPTFDAFLAEGSADRMAPPGVMAAVRRHFPDRRVALSRSQGNIFVLDGAVVGRGSTRVVTALGSRTMSGREMDEEQAAFSARVPALLADLARFGLEDSGEEPRCQLTFVLSDPR